MTTPNFLLDTTRLVRWFADRMRPSPIAHGAIDRADQIRISPIPWSEVGLVVRDGRVRLDRPVGSWIALVLADRRSVTAPSSPEAAAWVGQLDRPRVGQLDRTAFPGDPADRMLSATARDVRVPLVSRDGRLRRHASRSRDVDVIW